MGTPTIFLNVWLHGIEWWINGIKNGALTHPRAPIVGTLDPVKCLLTQANNDQSINIGWEQFLKDELAYSGAELLLNIIKYSNYIGKVTLHLNL